MIATVLLLAALVPSAALSIPGDGSHLDLRLEDVTVADALREFARLAHVEIRGAPSNAGARVKLDLHRVSLHEALGRILGTQSFVVFYRGQQPVRVVLIGASTSRALAAADPPGEARPDAAMVVSGGGGPDTTAEENAALEAAEVAAESNRAVTIHGDLARALGSDQVSFSDVTAVAMRDPDPAVRAEALRVGLGILETESALSDSFLQVLEQRDDDAVAAWLRHVAGDHALEIARQTASETRIEVLRARAGAIAQRLEAER